MKIIIIITFFIFSANNLSSQYTYCDKKYYTINDSLCLFIRESDETKSFGIYYHREEIPNKDAKPILRVDLICCGHDDTSYHFSEGFFEKKNNQTVCYDKLFNRYYTFDEIDEYTLVATKHTALFTKGDTLKMGSLYKSEDWSYQSMSWKGNKKDGTWYLRVGKDSIRYTEYKNDTIVREYVEAQKVPKRFREVESPPDTLVEKERLPPPSIEPLLRVADKNKALYLQRKSRRKK